MSAQVLQVLWAAPSIETPGAETLVVREASGKARIRGYEGKPAGEGQPFDAAPLTYWVTIDKAADVAARMLRGDPQTLGDARAALIVAAALVALAGTRPEVPRDITLPETPKAGDLG